MTCMLYLVRHAIAEDVSSTGRDADRRLTAEGAAKMQRAALGLQALGVLPDAIWTSPYRRTRETAELLRVALAPGLEPTLYAPLVAGTGTEAILSGLHAARAHDAVMLVGHEPDLGELAAHLIAGGPATGFLAFKKGAVAAIELDSLPPRSGGRLHWFLTPKQLRALCPD